MKKETSGLWNKLYLICDETATKRSGIKYLVKYYVTSLGWTEEEAIKYAIKLFDDGTIKQINLLGKEGKEI